MSVRNTCVDWLRGVEPHEDPAMKGKKDPDDGFFIKVPRRNVGPSTTQVNTESNFSMLSFLDLWNILSIWKPWSFDKPFFYPDLK